MIVDEVNSRPARASNQQVRMMQIVQEISLRGTAQHTHIPDGKLDHKMRKKAQG
jgi:hypothetical protein